ncbi:DUF1824 family protein [Argonema galeatum]|uniref:DUF1824 family protein n=1 Tax=Argonema galeatum TaxID=2942762 RepID=UPI0020129F80|nr:DUF1824 family protein [Argonema galeatum]MCL1463217.1 DUF1824 family protein [Argonema galeatum A003/A1]
MNTQNSTNLTVEQAQKILQQYSCTEVKPIESVSEKALVREALLLITNLSDYQNLGICADTATEGFSALESYLKGLGYKISLNTANILSEKDGVYIKFNTKKQSYYLDSYTGKYRGVLVSCQSSENESISGTYGHFPLNLFISVE